jgi:hypothetical protein
MQTIGAALLGIKLSSSMRVRMHAQDGRRAHGLRAHVAILIAATVPGLNEL